MNKKLSKNEILGVVRTIFGVSFVLLGMKFFLEVVAYGLSGALERWPILLGYFIFFLVFMSLTAWIGFLARRLTKNDKTDIQD